MKNFKIVILITLFITSFACSKDHDSVENQQKVNIIWGSDWDANGTYLRAFDLEKGIIVDTIYFYGCCGFENLNFNKLTKSLLVTYDGALYNLNISSHEFEFLLNIVNTSERGVLGLNLDTRNQILYGFDLIDSKYNLIKVDLNNNKLEVILKDFRPAGLNNYPPMYSALDETGQKLYLALSDSVFSFDIRNKKIEKAMKTGEITMLQFNPVINKLNGISFNKVFKLAKLDIYHNYISSSSFSRELNGFYECSTINGNTGDYILRTGGNEILIIEQDGTIENSYNFDGESGLGVQTVN